MPKAIKTEEKPEEFGPSCAPGTWVLRKTSILRAESLPTWTKVNRAWSNMPGATSLGSAMREGMSIDEALEAEAAKLTNFSEYLRHHFQVHQEMERELQELRNQRRAMRSFLGTLELPGNDD